MNGTSTLIEKPREAEQRDIKDSSSSDKFLKYAELARQLSGR